MPKHSLLPGDRKIMERLLEPRRLEAVELSSAAEGDGNPALDRLSRLACRMLGAPVSIVSLVDGHRQFHAGMHGLAAGLRELPLPHSFCKHIVASGKPMVIDNVQDHPLGGLPSVAELNIQAYIGVPLQSPENYCLGALCVIDNKPHQWTPEDLAALHGLVDFAVSEISLRCQILQQAVTEKKLLESDARFRAMARNVPGWLFQRSCNGDGTLKYTFFGKGENEPTTQFEITEMKIPFGMLGGTLHPNDEPKILEALRTSIVNKAGTKLHYRSIQEDGGVRWWSSQSSCREMAESGAIWDGFVFEVTELAQAHEAAEAANRAKDDLLANINHELRTPLNAILGYSEWLMESETSEKNRERARVIHLAGDNLLALVNQLLDSAATKHGGLNLACSPVDLHELTYESRRLVQDAADRKGLTLLISIGAGVPRKILGDGQRLRQAMVNLLSNAIKYSDTGQIAVALSYREQASADGSPRMRYAVKDSGIGIAADAQKRLFQRYSRVGKRGEAVRPGTGLGLYIVREYVAAMGGEVGVESAAGKGSTFWFEMPCAPVAMTTGANAHAGPRRVLVAEDNVANRAFLTDILVDVGYAVDSVADGALALQAITAKHYDLVLMDLQMPVMDGWMASRAIRALGASKGMVPILALTAATGANVADDCRSAGINATLSKPIDRKRLIHVVDRWLRSTAMAA